MKPYKSRVLILSLVLALIFGAVFYRLQDMIVVKSDAYSARAATKSTKTITVYGKRGTIYDTNMVPLAYDETNWNYDLSLSDKPGVFDRKTLKGSQFSQPLLEFSGACAGCGETPYAKLITQLYGEKTYWVNGVGCSTAWAGAFPSLAYTKNKEGRGPSFYATLFEDLNAYNTRQEVTDKRACRCALNIDGRNTYKHPCLSLIHIYKLLHNLKRY